MSDIDDCRKFVENLTRDRGEVMRAGDDKIEEIRARYAGYSLENFGNAHLANQDRGWLLAEVDKLRAENEKLRDQNKLFRGALDFVAAYRALDFDPQKNLAASHMSIVAREALEGKP